jgi:flagellar biosynthesis protein FlhF
MKIKTFHAVTMQDAIRAIKAELGPEAIILSSKEVRQGGRILRLFNRPVLEVMAASEQDMMEPASPAPHEVSQTAAPVPAEPAAAPSPLAAHEFQETLQSILKQAPAKAKTAPAAIVAPAKLSVASREKAKRLRELRTELQELSRLLGASLPPERQTVGVHLPPELESLSCSLVQQGLHPSTVESIGDDLCARLGPDHLSHHESRRQALRQAIAQRIRVSGPLLTGAGDRAIGLMLGPSGSGKTSVITKLAAQYRLEDKKSVAIITFDTYREAAVEQLRMYANVIGVPFASALSPRQVYEGLRRHSKAEVVLIDMPGVGPDEVAAANELHHLLQEESDVATHLVLPASMRAQDLRRIVESVQGLPSLRLLFTKLDETESFGTIVELAHQTSVPLSYWSAGQRVPEDIELASPERLADFLLAQRYVLSHKTLRHPSITQPRTPAPEPVGSSSN